MGTIEFVLAVVMIVLMVALEMTYYLAKAVEIL